MTTVLNYKLEYFKDATQPSDEGVFIHLDIDLPAYQGLIGKEDYLALDVQDQSAFVTGLFGIAGVMDVSAKANRLFITKSPIFTWMQVFSPLLVYLQAQLGATSVNELPGSGIAIDSPFDRRAL